MDRSRYFYDFSPRTQIRPRTLTSSASILLLILPSAETRSTERRSRRKHSTPRYGPPSPHAGENHARHPQDRPGQHASMDTTARTRQDPTREAHATTSSPAQVRASTDSTVRPAKPPRGKRRQRPARPPTSTRKLSNDGKPRQAPEAGVIPTDHPQDPRRSCRLHDPTASLAKPPARHPTKQPAEHPEDRRDHTRPPTSPAKY